MNDVTIYNLHHAEQLANLHSKDLPEDIARRVRWINRLRLIVGRRMPKNAMGVPLVSDIDLLFSLIEERVEALEFIDPELAKHVSHNHHACDCREEAHRQEIEKLNDSCDMILDCTNDIARAFLLAFKLIPFELRSLSQEELVEQFLEGETDDVRDSAQWMLEIGKIVKVLKTVLPLLSSRKNFTEHGTATLPD